MTFFTSVKSTLENNVELLRNEQGFFADVAYAINKTLADLTPDTACGSRSAHFKMAAQSLGETLKAAGGGIKHALWDEKNEFVGSVVETSGVQNPLGQAGLATFYTGLYYLKAFTYDAVVNTAKGFYQSGRTIANADDTEAALMGVAGLYGSAGAAAGMVAGVTGSGQIASKIGSTTFVAPMINGSEAALAMVAIPTGSLVAGAMPGGIGIVMMSASEENGGGNKPEDLAAVQSALEDYRRALINREVQSAADFIRKREKLPDDAKLAILEWDERRLNERLAILLAASRPPSWMARQLQKLSAFCRRVLEKD